ncbi:uncharacterized protein HMPREF1541_07798 [Cyphellophora europaea CBS 101466]|uniref:Uncharacterized protein n=1 Tax=Cyphellophora europaea (strain CBS 101466) TaxID=1220924 RepID=W2RK12_CYPE1|nr:uncharacterized protein HMPREF1541_07798 [Cyphellophora europaea CBS 101466]ETN36811.1 hypothetical protein HMPREF1541_07798 [Cyphellophora europaea CBS 101466]
MLATSLHSAGLQDFHEPQLFFGTKGTKLRFKSTPHCPTLLDVIEEFQIYLADIINMEHVDKDRFFTDIAREVCPPVSVLAQQALAFNEQLQTYLWKQCCQEQHASQIYDSQPLKKGGRGHVPPKRSLLYKGGIHYFQLYASVKEVWDVVKTMPFNNDGLEEMALDPLIQQAARHVQGGSTRDAHIIKRSYEASKRRAHQAIQDSQHKLFSIHKEYRISWRLFTQLQARLTRVPAEELAPTLNDCPSSTWAI